MILRWNSFFYMMYFVPLYSIDVVSTLSYMTLLLHQMPAGLWFYCKQKTVWGQFHEWISTRDSYSLKIPFCYYLSSTGVFTIKFYVSTQVNPCRMKIFIIVLIVRASIVTRWTNVLPPNLVRSRSREIGYYNDRIAQKVDSHLDQRCCRGACQISERLEKAKPESRGFKTSRDLAERRPSA